MDKKKKRGKFKENVDEENNDDRVSKKRNDHEIFMPDCYCPQSGRNGLPSDMSDLRSRVKIVGRIGIDQDENYILDCAASVDDKPIKTNIQGNLKGQHLERRARHEHESRKRGHRDFTMQANICDCVNGPIDVQFSSAATQCSPANFNYVSFSNIEKLEIASNPNQRLYQTNPNQALYCYCNSDRNTTNLSDHESHSQTPHGCSSPLVIISVYPKHESTGKESDHNTDEKRSIKNFKFKSPMRKPNASNMNSKRVSGGKQNPVNENNNKTRSPGSPGTPRSPRSRSPAIETTSRKLNKTTLSPKLKTEENQTEHKGIKPKITKEQSGTPKKSDKNTKQTPTKKTSRDTSPRGQKMTPNTSKIGPNKVQQNYPSIRKMEKYETARNHLTEDPALTKKAIVDAYTKKVTAQKNFKQANAAAVAKNDTSNVAVNIDGEKEYYDVIFHQGDRTTDLRFRKTMKNQEFQQIHVDAHARGVDSLENLFYMPEEPPPKRTTNPTDDGEFGRPSSRLKDIVRDSIELSHREMIVTFPTPLKETRKYDSFWECKIENLTSPGMPVLETSKTEEVSEKQNKLNANANNNNVTKTT